ncbi:hypothetical protein [Pseudomonas sp. Marseille-QA0892]
MDGKQAEQKWEQWKTKALADHLGITMDEVSRWVTLDYPKTTDAGIEYGHIVQISKEAPETLIQKLGGTSVDIGPLLLEDKPDHA